MKRKLSRIVAIAQSGALAATTGLAATLSIGLLAATPSFADDMQGSIARGGRLYDKWFKEIGAQKPADTHALWPSSNTKKSGDVTWRCKSCHGWDLKGKDGAYASGSYKTGITGLTAYAGKDPAEVVAIMKGPDHGYSGMMADQDFADLANFVTMGQVDFADYINYDDKTVKGDAAKGEPIYATVCAMCHGADGKQPKEMEDKGVGALARHNPQEIMHKIMNGQPHEVMTPLRAFGADTVANVLAYAQTLPD